MSAIARRAQFLLEEEAENRAQDRMDPFQWQNRGPWHSLPQRRLNWRDMDWNRKIHYRFQKLMQMAKMVARGHILPILFARPYRRFTRFLRTPMWLEWARDAMVDAMRRDAYDFRSHWRHERHAK
jgi:hypothetical protein